MRGVTDISGLRDIRSMHSTRRSIPRFKNSAFLDLYMLQKEKERLEKEAALLAKRSQGLQKRLGEIQRQMGGLERSAQTERSGNGGETTERSRPAKKWKSFSVNY